MKTSELFFPTLREVPSEAEIVSHQLLLRAGYIRKASGGVYSYLPLANRVLKKIMQIVREEMDMAGGQEIMMPIIQPKELWEQSGRWEVYGDEMFRLSDRHERLFALGPTHEEIITSLVNADVYSYRDLPLLLYQIQNKYRDEIRPRFGLIRGREFIMKDAYSFDEDYEGLETNYQKMMDAYNRVFTRIGLRYRMVEADNGAIGGTESHEFMVLAESGENTVVYCPNCNYASNLEIAAAGNGEKAGSASNGTSLLPLQKTATPGQKSIKDVAAFFKVPEAKLLKTLLLIADGEPVIALLRGDRELNEIKMKRLLRCGVLLMAGDTEAKQYCGAGFGSLGPVGISLPVYADKEIETPENLICGANEDGFHYVNVNAGRDFTPVVFEDIRNVTDGEPCPLCSSPLASARSIEVGQIFKLGVKYSEAMEAVFLNKEGVSRKMVMGSYGIGVSRTMAAAVEQNYDENGIVWPLAIAPYQVIIVPVNSKNEEQIKTAGDIYERLLKQKIEVLFDDRDERPGVKFKDADLIGIPLRITIGPKSLQAGRVELKKRWLDEIELIDISVIDSYVADLLQSDKK
ncbi:MAG: proline--tRNA ligase [Syntrophomonadaceae bacterium]|nr:proline--tRNA ligase [Syntrophomonadaceae bacterium]